MKILLTTPTYPPFNSGLGNAVHQLASTLIARGCEVVVATSGALRGQRQDPELNICIEEFDVSGANFLLNPIRGADADAYERFLLASNFDLLVLNAWQTWSTDIALRNLARIRGRKVLFSHCVSTNTLLPLRPLRSLLRYLAWRPYWHRLPGWMRGLDGMIFLASTGCDDRFDDVRLAHKLGLPFEVIPNALSPAACSMLDAPPSPRTQLISIGAYEWQKGHDFVLRTYAASIACNRIPLKIFGQRFTPYTDELRKLRAKLHLSNAMVSFHEGISGAALAEEYQGSLALVSGSHTECQPLVLLDAMAAGTPFIARATGCIPDLAGGISVRTEAAAAQALDSLLAADDVWLTFAEAGRMTARTQHHPDRISERISETLLQGMSA